MNILFIEDEKELAATGVAQLELKGHTVYLAYDLSEARQVLKDPQRTVHCVITDHRLPDGMGIQFVIGLKESSPRCKCAVVSGCFTDKDMEQLEAHTIPYYHKPLLYVKVIDELRRAHAAQAPAHVEPALIPEPEPTAVLESEPAAQTGEAGEAGEAKKGFKIWPFK